MRLKIKRTPMGMTTCPACGSFVSKSEATRAATLVGDGNPGAYITALREANEQIASLQKSLQELKLQSAKD